MYLQSKYTIKITQWADLTNDFILIKKFGGNHEKGLSSIFAIFDLNGYNVGNIKPHQMINL